MRISLEKQSGRLLDKSKLTNRKNNPTKASMKKSVPSSYKKSTQSNHLKSSAPSAGHRSSQTDIKSHRFGSKN